MRHQPVNMKTLFRCCLLVLSTFGLVSMLSACVSVGGQGAKQAAIYATLRTFYIDGLEKGAFVTAYFATDSAAYKSRKHFDEKKWREERKSIVGLYERIQQKIQENGGIAQIDILDVLHGTGIVNTPSEYDRVTYKVTYKNGKSFIDKERIFVRAIMVDEGDQFHTLHFVEEKRKTMLYPEGDVYKINAFRSYVWKDRQLGIAAQP